MDMRHDFRPAATLPFTALRPKFSVILAPRLMAAAGLLLAAAGLAAVAAMSASRWLDAEAERRAGKLAAPIAMTEIWVARSDLAAGAPFSPAMVQKARWPATSVPSSAVAGEATALLGLAGRRLAADLPAGAPLLEGHLLARGAGSTLAHRLSPGMRAVTVPVTASSGLAGLVRPGDRVDLLFSGALPDGRRISATALPDVKVLGLDQQIDAGDAAGVGTTGAAVPATVTLEVTPEAAETVAFLAEAGRLSLSLRGEGGDGLGAPEGAADGDPRALAGAAAALAARIGAAFRAAEAPAPQGPGGPADTRPATEAPATAAPATAAPGPMASRREGGVTVARGSSIRAGGAGPAATEAAP
ncbi:Flp pilus assembly protein CpaB [Thermaurantiacus sp.]